MAKGLVIAGTGGDDVIVGTAGGDRITGLDGNDTLTGGAGSDTLSGGNGDDILTGGAGHDLLLGGAGADTFVFDAASAAGCHDSVSDFSVAEGDVLELNSILSGFNPLNISDFIHVTDKGGRSIVSIDADGALNGAHFSKLAVLDGVTGLDAAALFAGGNLTVT